MPEFPDTVRVRLGTKVVEYVVAGVKDCPACGRTIFFVETGNLKPDGTSKIMPVDTEAADDGVRVSHFATCTNPGRFRRKLYRADNTEIKKGSRRPGKGDRPR